MPRPVVAFRTACSEAIGFGHLRRCLTLAQAVRRDADPHFVIVADARGGELAEDSGFPVEVVDAAGTGQALERLAPAGVVVDDYALTAPEITALQERFGHVLAIDDLAAQPLAVDAVLNANPGAEALPYELPASCLRLFGVTYALLRPEFRDLPAHPARANVERVLVTLGGSNPGGRAATIVRDVLAALPSATVELIAGPLFEGELPADPRLVVHRSPRDMVDLMVRADLAIAAGGQTTYELAACGVPTVALCLADNQRANLAALAAAPTLRIAGDDHIAETVRELAEDHAARALLARTGQQLVDGRGADRAWQALSSRWLGATS